MQPVSAQSVLIVDDALTWRKLLAGLLRQWGYHVLEAEEGEQALALLRQHPVNLLISDWEMPVMDGLTLCRQVRQQFRQRYIYVILLTVRESTDDLRAGFAAGVVAGTWPTLASTAQFAAVRNSREPTISAARRAEHRSQWHEAVSRAQGWIPELSALDF